MGSNCTYVGRERVKEQYQVQLVQTADMAQQGVADIAFLSFVGRFRPFLSCTPVFFGLLFSEI